MIEIVPENLIRKDPKGEIVNLSPEEAINKIVSQISKHWGSRQLYIDVGLLSPSALFFDGNHFLTMVSQHASTLGLSFIPVIRVAKDQTYNSAVKAVTLIHGQGACIRLTHEEIKQPELANKIDTLLAFLEISPENVDLMIDFQFVGQGLPTFKTIYKVLPHVDEWRNLIWAGGAFPEDLSKLKKNDIYWLPRNDWTSWREQIVRSQSGLRLPIFSDYTIQHPRYRDLTGRLMNISASIRYTSEKDWVIMRGESISAEGGPGTSQWPANAALLCEREEYCGDGFSYGDRYIKNESSAFDKPGNATTWLCAGINHHMTFAVRQLATLFDSSIVALSSS